jgi:hypothetical protein
MDNEPAPPIINGDTTDTHSQAGGIADNASRHSSRVGSARSGRSKAASIREATTIDGLNDQKPPKAASPKPDALTNGDRQPSAVVKSKPASPRVPVPAVPVVDTPAAEYDDEVTNQDDDFVRSESEAIVSLVLGDVTNYFC